MLNPYEMTVLRAKLNSGDPVDPPRAIYTLSRHIDNLERRLAEIEKSISELQAGKKDRD
jgi:hypothetical protein